MARCLSLLLLICCYAIQAFQLDDLLLQDLSAVKQSDIRSKDFWQARYPYELLSYSKKQTILGHGIREAILRFHESGKFKSASITIAYTVNREKYPQIMEIENDITSQFQKSMTSGFEK